MTTTTQRNRTHIKFSSFYSDIADVCRLGRLRETKTTATSMRRPADERVTGTQLSAGTQTTYETAAQVGSAERLIRVTDEDADDALLLLLLLLQRHTETDFIFTAECIFRQRLWRSGHFGSLLRNRRKTATKTVYGARAISTVSGVCATTTHFRTGCRDSTIMKYIFRIGRRENIDENRNGRI